MTALSHRLPPITPRSNAFQRVVNAVAAALLRAGRVWNAPTLCGPYCFGRHEEERRRKSLAVEHAEAEQQLGI